VSLLSWDTSSPRPDPAVISGTTRYHPESPGTIGISRMSPRLSNANPGRMITLGRRFPAFLPASSATPNMLSERGARLRPARTEERADRLSALLPDEDPEHGAAHPDDGERRADRVDLPRSRVRDVLDGPDAQQDDHHDHVFRQEADAPRQVGGEDAAEERADDGGGRGRRADRGLRLALRGSLEVPADERLHRGQQQRGAEPPDHRPGRAVPRAKRGAMLAPALFPRPSPSA
jgi:hypothetical protein